MANTEYIFTPASLLDLLSQIDELSEYELGITEDFEGELILQIGNSHYSIAQPDKAEFVNLPQDAVEDISDINEEAYEDLIQLNDSVEELEPIESGLIKEALKTLLIGGVVRLGKKYLTE